MLRTCIWRRDSSLHFRDGYVTGVTDVADVLPTLGRASRDRPSPAKSRIGNRRLEGSFDPPLTLIGSSFLGAICGSLLDDRRTPGIRFLGQGGRSKVGPPNMKRVSPLHGQPRSVCGGHGSRLPSSCQAGVEDNYHQPKHRLDVKHHVQIAMP